MTGAQFRRAKDELGLSLAATARELGVSARTVARWQASDAEIPRPIEKLMLVLLEQKRQLRQLVAAQKRGS